MSDNQVEFDILANISKASKSVEDFVKDTQEQLAGIQLSLGVTAVNQALDLAQKAYDTAKKIIEKPLQIAIDGEKVKSIQVQFQLLSDQAGIAGDALKVGLEKASGGLADTTSTLQAANRAFIELGVNSNKLPQTLELARKATIAFGGDLISNFEGINQAIATGNTRALRALGLTIDRDQAEKNFAKSLGVSVGTLNEAGRQQAILNEVLDKGNSSFKNINDQTLQTTNAWKELGVAIKEAGDQFKVGFANTFGDALSGIATGFTSLFRQFTGTLPINDQLKQVNDEIARIKAGGPAFEASMSGALDGLTTKAKALQNQIDLVAIAQDDARKASRSAPSTSLVNPELAEADRLKVKEVFAKSQQDLITSQLALATINGDADTIENLRFQQRFSVLQQYELKKDALRRDFLSKGLINQDQFNQLEVSLEEEKNARIAALQETANENILKVKQLVQSNVVNGLTSAFSQLGAALVKGSNGFEAFGKAVISALGAMAIQIGTLLLTIGLGFQTLGPILPVFGLSGAAAVAAGLGLIALGGVLQAIGGGTGGGATDTGGGSSTASDTGGGGLTAGSSGVSGLTDLNKSTSGQVININVAGNVLDRREFGLELVTVLQDHFNNNGALVTGAS